MKYKTRSLDNNLYEANCSLYSSDIKKEMKQYTNKQNICNQKMFVSISFLLII